MENTVSIAKKAPFSLFIIFGVFTASYMFTGMYAESTIGRPSSTAALGYIFAPIYSLIAGFIGYCIGFVLKFFLLKRGKKDIIRKKVFVKNRLLLILAVALLSGGAAFKQMVDYEKFNSPKLLKNDKDFIVTKYSEQDIPSVTTPSTLVWDFQNNEIETTNWLNNNYNFTVSESTNLNIINGNTIEATYDFSGRTYITEISTVTLATSANNDYLAVLVKLRATSRRSMLLVYDESFNLVYEELLKRCGRKQYTGVTQDISGNIMVINLCKPFTIDVNK